MAVQAGQPARCSSSHVVSASAERTVHPLGEPCTRSFVRVAPVVGPATQPREPAHRSTRRVGSVVPPSRAASAGGIGFALGGERLAEALAGAGQERPRRDVADAEGGGQLETGQVVQLGEQQRRALPFGDPRQGPLHVAGQPRIHHEVLGRRRRAPRLTGPRQEPDDLAPADLVERDAVGDLVQPGSRVLGLLEASS